MKHSNKFLNVMKNGFYKNSKDVKIIQSVAN